MIVSLYTKGKAERGKGKSVNLKFREEDSESLCNVLCIFSWERACVGTLVYKTNRSQTWEKALPAMNIIKFLVFVTVF